MSRSLDQQGDTDREDTARMQRNREAVDPREDLDPERVDHASEDEKSGGDLSE